MEGELPPQIFTSSVDLVVHPAPPPPPPPPAPPPTLPQHPTQVELFKGSKGTAAGDGDGEAPDQSTGRKSVFSFGGGGDGSGLKPKDYKATLCAMNASTNDDLHKSEVAVQDVDVAKGEGGISVLTMSFGKSGGSFVLPGKLSDKVVDSLEVKIEEVNNDSTSSELPPVSYRIVIHRSENEVNKAMGNGSNKPSATTAPNVSIYPLLNQVYEEVGSVEVEVSWGGPEGWMSKAKVDSIIHQTKGDGGKITSFSIDDVAYDDPIRRVRESMEKNRSWMSEVRRRRRRGEGVERRCVIILLSSA